MLSNCYVVFSSCWEEILKQGVKIQQLLVHDTKTMNVCSIADAWKKKKEKEAVNSKKDIQVDNVLVFVSTDSSELYCAPR